MLHLIGQSALSAFRVDKVQALISAEHLPGQLVGTYFHYLVDHSATLTDQDVARLETLLIATSLCCCPLPVGWHDTRYPSLQRQPAN